ncbi:DUF4352 domain-containing protein [Candidatus Dojkabacteria bacterium]|nr:DUF4352 domain-containing protein [Candidatus Dojkabacteria bacterium]
MASKKTKSSKIEEKASNKEIEKTKLQENGKTLRVILIVALVLLVLSSPLWLCGGCGLLAALLPESETSTTTSKKVYPIGETAKAGDVSFKVTKVEDLGNSVQPEWGNPITTNGKFIRVDYQIENLSYESQYPPVLKVLDSQERTYEESGKKFTILSFGDEVEIFEEISPNVKTDYATIFEIPEDAVGLELKVSDFGLFPTKYAYFDLGL